MAKSSIHIKPIKANSETHNFRKIEYKHVRKDLTHLNFSSGRKDQEGNFVPLKKIRKELEILVKEKTGRKMQKKATPIREGVFLFTAEHSNKEIVNSLKGLSEKFGIRPIQIHLHRDEGHYEKHTNVWKSNLHAHVVFEWIDRNTGKSFKLDKKDMSEMQTHFAERLSMERGKKSLKTHLNAVEYKIKLAEEELKNVEKKLTLREKTELTAFRFLADKNPKLKEAVKKAIPIVRKMNKSRGKTM
jgi:predicted DNA-binding protein YlxM (UPF0122 family)